MSDLDFDTNSSVYNITVLGNVSYFECGDSYGKISNTTKDLANAHLCGYMYSVVKQQPTVDFDGYNVTIRDGKFYYACGGEDNFLPALNSLMTSAYICGLQLGSQYQYTVKSDATKHDGHVLLKVLMGYLLLSCLSVFTLL